MLQGHLLRKIDTKRWVKSDQASEYSLPITEFPRVLEIAPLSKADVVFSLKFDTDEEGRQLIELSVGTTLDLECQRCLERVKYPVESHVVLTPVQSEDEARLIPDHYEPVLAVEGLIDTVQMIEDELLLEMPMFYRHDIDACGVKSSDELRGEQKTKPFAQLAELFKK